MNTQKVAVLGPLKTFTHLAAISYFGEDVEYIPAAPWDVCKLAKKRDVDFAVLPIENISHGFVETTLDALYSTADIHIHDEIYLPIHHQLMTTAKSLSDIEVIYSHPQAFAQCKHRLAKLEKEAANEKGVEQFKFKRLKLGSTVEGAKMIQENDALARTSDKCAVIASREASAEYGLPILRENIQDRPDNVTRFWVLSMGVPHEPTDRDRTAFLIEIEHDPGALNNLLNQFTSEGCNLLSLNTRPIYSQEAEGRWEYAFFLEYEGHVKAELASIYRVLHSGKQKLLRNGRRARLLGSYPNQLEIPALASK
jgi:chorismate mutase / prephenate dehydratase